MVLREVYSVSKRAAKTTPFDELWGGEVLETFCHDGHVGRKKGRMGEWERQKEEVKRQEFARDTVDTKNLQDIAHDLVTIWSTIYYLLS